MEVGFPKLVSFDTADIYLKRDKLEELKGS